MDDRLPVISLFSGAGGLDLAVEQAGTSASDPTGLLRVAMATDYDQAALHTLSKNLPDTPTICADITTLSPSDLLSASGLDRKEPVLVVGGPPCTPFSKSGFWLPEKRESRDPNASLLDNFVDVVEYALPDAFILENVQGLTYSTHRDQFSRILNRMSDLGYNPRFQVLLAADYGVPQLRRRVFVVGRRDGVPFQFPESTHSGWSEHSRAVDASKIPHVSSSEAFENLPPTSREPEEIVEGQFAELAAEIPPGQNYLWHTDRYQGRNIFKWRSRYWTFLLRLDPMRPSTTLQAQPGPWVGPFHWENVRNADGLERARRLRVPEMLRLMSFPDDFVLPGTRMDAQRQLGNAVPVRLGRIVVEALLTQMGYLTPPDRPAASVSTLF